MITGTEQRAGERDKLRAESIGRGKFEPSQMADMAWVVDLRDAVVRRAATYDLGEGNHYFLGNSAKDDNEMPKFTFGFEVGVVSEQVRTILVRASVPGKNGEMRRVMELTLYGDDEKEASPSWVADIAAEQVTSLGWGVSFAELGGTRDNLPEGMKHANLSDHILLAAGKMEPISMAEELHWGRGNGDQSRSGNELHSEVQYRTYDDQPLDSQWGDLYESLREVARVRYEQALALGEEIDHITLGDLELEFDWGRMTEDGTYEGVEELRVVDPVYPGRVVMLFRRNLWDGEKVTVKSREPRQALWNTSTSEGVVVDRLRNGLAEMERRSVDEEMVGEE